MLYQEAAERYKELSKECRILENKLTKYPKGKLHIVKNKGKTQYYLRSDPKDKSGIYIHKSEEKMINQYLQKKYDEEIYSVIKKEKDNLEKFLAKSKESNKKIQNIYSNNPQEIKEILKPIDVSDEDYISQWLGVPFEGKAIGEDVPVYLTDKGEHVRSKSELNIANALCKLDIPYKYECPLKFSGGRVIYPDFTVLNVKRRKEIYWEHRGMMDSKEYATHSVSRIKQLAKDGVFLGDNLIITEETSVNPLGTDEIIMTIRHYL